MERELITIVFRGIIDMHDPQVAFWLATVTIEGSYIELEFDYGAETTTVKMYDPEGIASLRRLVGRRGHAEIINADVFHTPGESYEILSDWLNKRDSFTLQELRDFELSNNLWFGSQRGGYSEGDIVLGQDALEIVHAQSVLWGFWEYGDDGDVVRKTSLYSQPV